MGLKHLLTGFYQRVVVGTGRRLPDHEEEDAVLDEIDRIAQETDSTILPVRRFRKKILPSVQHAMAYISGLILQIPGSVDFDPDRWEDDPLLRAMFISREEMIGVLQSSKALKDFFR